MRIIICVLRGGTLRKPVQAIDEKQDVSLVWPYINCTCMHP